MWKRMICQANGKRVFCESDKSRDWSCFPAFSKKLQYQSKLKVSERLHFLTIANVPGNET